MSRLSALAAAPLLAGILVACGLLAPAEGLALPRMALTAGSPCSTCHVLPQGGGARNTIGWGSEHWAGAIPWQKLGLASLEESEDPGFFDNRLLVGGDLRTQIARLGRPVIDPKGDADSVVFSGNVPGTPPDYMAIPMQMQPYVTALPMDWLMLTGSFNVSALKTHYPGQGTWDAAVIVKGKGWVPGVRAGMIQPSIGVRHDDHTMLLRSDAISPRQPIIPPNYAELGAELHWQPKSWLQVNAGGFANSQLRKTVTSVAAGPAWLARVAVLPQFLDWRVNTWLGASAFGSDEFMLLNAFAGVGKDKVAALMVEGSASRRAGEHETLNLMAKLALPLKPWLVLEGRVEQAATKTKTRDLQTRQLVLGAQLLPIAYLELRPEYRLIKTDEYALGQYTLQVHAFF